ncbi:MAG: hypothetical protein Q7K13_07260 [Polynucleobacter sp.]|uniref:hypothetical protein n=1 Tax=Polynucleobacter sp. TaxID=2029855 RepID=UPI00271E58E2|nr:hypothetical protein [Polynucleobacter sp.]MDO8714258.1 hypothetical protein [Polynucleobacter sp.]
MTTLKKEYQFYLENQDELVTQHNGKYLVIHDCKVCGAYGSRDEAIAKARGELKLKLGQFLVQKCTPGDSDIVQHFHSRVAFAHA